VHLLCERNGGIIVGKLAISTRVGGPQADAVVDVQDTRGAAGRPDDSSSLDVVLLGIHLSVDKSAAAGGAHAGRGRLARILREEIAGYEIAFQGVSIVVYKGLGGRRVALVRKLQKPII
jgi:hypothetical protein